ncbi:hypothetical protein BDV97DRAFT_379093 [Delphinella strobiligena]|nr:hypothetical protein BDV97DRAFT_379093 [Delphinella strobiligena]
MVSARIAEAFSDGRINTTAYPYITPEYLSETRDPQAIGAIIFLLCFTTIVLVLRVFSRVFLVKSFGLDDGLAIFGFVLFVAFTAMGLVLIKEGSGRHLEYIQYILTPEEVDLTEINDYAAHLIYTTALFVCRLSGLAFYYRLCIRHQVLLRIVIAATVFLVSAFLPQFFLILLHCSPTTGLWPYAWQTWTPTYTCLPWGVVYVTNSALSLVCDFIIFTIPIAIITMIKLSKERKVMLAFVLLPGTFVIAISCVRLWLCVVGQWRDDGSWYYNPQIAIEVAEIGGTLIALSIPGLKALIGTDE